MAESELATKAPESEATEAVAPTEPAEPAAAAPAAGGVSEHCVTDRPTPVGQSSTGEIRKLGDVDVYISKPNDYPHAPARLLLFLTGGTGLHSTNNQIQADRFASEGFVVVMPDLFSGDPAPNSRSTAVEDPTATAASPSQTPSLLDQFKTKAAETAKSFLIDMWLARHTEEKVLPILHKVLEASREEFADAVSNGGGTYGVGYCFGGRYILLLGSAASAAQGGPQKATEDEESAPALPPPALKAGALAHATLVSLDDFQALKSPTSLVCVEDDPMFPNDIRKALEDHLAKSSIEHEVQVYPGVPHGFAVVGEYEDASIKAAQATAFEQMLKWLKEH